MADIQHHVDLTSAILDSLFGLENLNLRFGSAKRKSRN
jgi:hypothetical protein